MKILHIEFGRHLYGGALQVYYLMRGLQQEGFQNILACDRGSEIGREAKGIAEVEELSMTGEIDPRILLQLNRIIRKHRPDILHVHSRRGADLWGGLAARMQGVSAVLTRRVDNPEKVWIARAKYGMYERIAAISGGIREVLLEAGLSADKVDCIHSAVDSQRYQGPRDRQWLQREFGIAPEQKAVAVIAQLIPRKGHRFLIEAAPRVLESCPDARFLILGKGPLREELEAACSSAGVARHFIFAGFREDVPRILPCCDLVVHPALMEGLGVSLLQAAAAGIPVVAGRAGGIPEIVRDGINGYLIEAGNVDDLATRTIEVLLSKDMAKKFGSAGKKIVSSDFSIARMVDRYMSIYSKIEK